MKGIVLAGGEGTRLRPLTLVANKHLLPIWNAPMIYHPLNTLIQSGIDDIMVITGKEYCGSFIELLGNKFNGASITYRVQEESGGIGQALGLCKNFANDDNVAVILGDNLFEDRFDFSDFGKKGEMCRIYLKKVSDPWKFGVAKFEEKQGPYQYRQELVDIIEKPEKGKEPGSFVQTGLYLYKNDVFEIIDRLKPSKRGEIEITDVNLDYLRRNLLDYKIIKGFWIDSGSSFEDLYKAASFVKNVGK